MRVVRTASIASTKNGTIGDYGKLQGVSDVCPYVTGAEQKKCPISFMWRSSSDSYLLLIREG
jgi:hypothetical protein